MNLLIVDDQPLVTDGLEQGIPWESLGFRNIFKAYNALDARSILLAHPIAVMLCDIQMPVENGLELFAWMRQSGMDTRMIFLTSHAEFEYAQQALKLGSVDYIVQPAPYSDTTTLYVLPYRRYARTRSWLTPPALAEHSCGKSRPSSPAVW